MLLLTDKHNDLLVQNMSSLVERLRVRSERRPVYNLDESDEEFDYKRKKPGSAQEIFERLERDDKVCLLF